MPLSLCQCTIVCLPKGNKDRILLKNWRPISLLSVIYKLASSVIADRLKRNLDQIISKSQTGFVPGRHMSDSSRLIYDIMFHAERENKNWLLLLIDSLEATLNMLEIFGNFSGLKMNMEKTKVIWIGRKCYSKEKLNVNYNLQWGSHEFFHKFKRNFKYKLY